MTKEGKRNRSDCATSATLDLIGDRWSLLIVRAHVFGGMREYSDFLSMPEGISTNVLADRLSWLVENGLLTKHRHPTNGTKFFYDITGKGFDLIFVIMELAMWGLKYVPGSFSPPEIEKAYRADPKAFFKDWKKRARDMSKDYLAKQK